MTGVTTRRRRPSRAIPVLSIVAIVVVGATIWAVAQWTGPSPASADDGPVPSREPSATAAAERPRGTAALPSATAKGPEPVRTAPRPTTTTQATPTQTSNAGARSLMDRRSLPTEPAGDASGGMLSGAIATPNATPTVQPIIQASAQPAPAQPLPDARPIAADRSETSAAIPASTPAAATPPAEAAANPADRALAEARDRVSRDRPLEARSVLNAALASGAVDRLGSARLRSALAELHQSLVFSPRVVPGDPISAEYRVQPGDSLARIARRQELLTHWRLIQRVNALSDPTKIRVDQRLKLVRGPFHAVVDKSEFRMDLYWGSPDRPADWLFVRSFPVGLGADDGTPVGQFVVSSNKLEDPGWVNPRNPSERYEPKDPKNPIGRFWVGLDGIGASAGVAGYGIHGTIEPESIGRSMSMGCVRLGDADIALVYELLEERVSVVHIVE